MFNLFVVMKWFIVECDFELVWFEKLKDDWMFDGLMVLDYMNGDFFDFIFVVFFID